MATVFTDNFDTEIGTVCTWIEAINNPLGLLQNNYEPAAGNYEITFQSFDLTDSWLPESMKLETSRGWRYFIRKISPRKQKLALFCKLLNPASDTIYDVCSGEGLDAVEIENSIRHLHIGTEDGETLQFRAEKSDWLPQRFRNELNFSNSFTEYVDFGFKTTVPDLAAGEEIYFHFIVATNSIQQSKDYPGERDNSTWFAVDQNKGFLDNKLESAGTSTVLLV